MAPPPSDDDSPVNELWDVLHPPPSHPPLSNIEQLVPRLTREEIEVGIKALSDPDRRRLRTLCKTLEQPPHYVFGMMAVFGLIASACVSGEWRHIREPRGPLGESGSFLVAREGFLHALALLDGHPPDGGLALRR